MHIIESILLNNRIEKNAIAHNKNKEPVPSGVVSKLWEWGLEYRDGKITKQELEKKIEENIKQ